MSFKTKKVRKMFPKKGPEKKALNFFADLVNAPENLRKNIYKKVLRRKKGKDKEEILKIRKTLKNRKIIFNEFQILVNEYKSKYADFNGVIVFGGVVKKHTSPTDLDFIFVGYLPKNAKANFCKALKEKTGVPANPFPINLKLSSKINPFERLLSIPYLHSPKEWTVQNFVGSNMDRRKLKYLFNSAYKKLKIKGRLAIEKQ